MISNELDKIRETYAERTNDSSETEAVFSKNITQERAKIYQTVLKENFQSLKNVKIIEVGSGNGYNLDVFIDIGLKKENIFANELLDERVEAFKQRNPDLKIFPGNVLDLSFDFDFDIVFQSSVFTSILDEEFRVLIANKMWTMLKENGIVLWYDFIYDNPSNKSVRKVSKKEIIKLFPTAKSIQFYSCTLAPPIARRVGKWYSVFNLFPFLRTHVVAVIKK